MFQPLTVNKAIFSFSSYVLKDISALPTRIVDGINTYFGYNAVYVIREIDSSNNIKIHELYGDNRYKRDHALYKEQLMKSDLFERNMTKVIEESVARHKMVWTLQDFGYSGEDFFQTEYGKLASKSGFGYRALIVSPQPLGKYFHSLSIYKTKYKGDFTHEERVFLEQLATVFNILLHAYLEHLKQQSLMQLFNQLFLCDHKYVCVLDAHLDTVFKADDFDKVSEKFFATKRQFRDFVFHIVGNPQKRSDGVLYDSVHESDGDQCRVVISVFVPKIGPSVNDSKLICITVTYCHALPSADTMPFSQSKLEQYDFTPRELEVLMLLQEESIDGIAEKLFLSKSTVRTHISHIYRKLDVNSRLEAIMKLK